VDIGGDDNIPNPDDGPAKIGEIIGQYRIVSVLGFGGTAWVYLAEHILLARPVALKVLVPELTTDQSYISRFLYEAKVVNDVRHPNIVDVSNFVRTDNPPRVALVMELLEGESLDVLLERQKKLSTRQAVNICAQVANALTVVHEVGVIHRDLKPANIIVIESPESDFSKVPSIKVLDFGIAKNIEDESAGHMTTAGIVLGTPQYMAPEQIVGKPSSPKTDVYALGELLYELLSGIPVFEGNRMQIFRAKLSNRTRDLPLPIDTEGSEILREILSSCLAIKLEDRPALSEFVDVLTQLSHEPEAPPVVALIARTPSEAEIFEPLPEATPESLLQETLTSRAPEDEEEQAREAFPATASNTTRGNRPSLFFIMAAMALLLLAAFALKTSIVGEEQPKPRIDSKPSSARAKAPAVPRKKLKSEPTLVLVASTPPGAEIFDVVTKKSHGVTPAHLPVSKGISRQLELRLPGFLPEAITLASTSTSIQVPLKPDVPTQTPPPKTEPVQPSDSPGKNPLDGPMTKRDMPTW
jgi:eukaryotic-like serine/threonine-protein kinase